LLSSVSTLLPFVFKKDADEHLFFFGCCCWNPAAPRRSGNVIWDVAQPKGEKKRVQVVSLSTDTFGHVMYCILSRNYISYYISSLKMSAREDGAPSKFTTER
jgi:hypothetical protein